MFLNILKRGPIPPQKLQIKPITRIVHTTPMRKVTDDIIQNPLPADQQLGR